VPELMWLPGLVDCPGGGRSPSVVEVPKLRLLAPKAPALRDGVAVTELATTWGPGVSAKFLP